MALTYATQTTSIANGSATTGTASITSPTNYSKTQIGITVSSGAANVTSVKIESAFDGSNYVTVTEELTGSDIDTASFFVDGIFPNLRVSFTSSGASTIAIQALQWNEHDQS